jgi:subtilisin family serine protease
MLLILLPAVVAQPIPSGGPLPRHAEGELLVKFNGGPRGTGAEQVQARMQHEVKRHFDFIGWQHIRLPRGMTVEEGLARYREMRGVEAVEPNGVGRLSEPQPTTPSFAPASAGDGNIPNDPLFPQQWALAKIGATNAWAVTTGSSNVVVAILDTGINYNHEDLAANMWRNPGEIPGNGIDDDGNGYIDDVFGIDTANDPLGNDSNPWDQGLVNLGPFYHGTAMAGIIGAVGNNNRGIVGVSWFVNLMAIRVVATNGFFFIANTIQALDYAVLMKRRGVNLQVINLSYGDATFFSSQAMKDAHARVAAEGMLQVAIAQNQAIDIDRAPVFPASFEISNIISVAASDSLDNLAWFSNYGRTNVDLAAPGVDTVMTSGATTSAYYNLPGNNLTAGTSYSAPYVAGAAALLFAANPEATAAEVKAALLDTVDVLPAFTSKMVSNGRLNVGRAMAHPAIAPNSPPFIAAPPQSRIANEGANANLVVTAYGTRPLSYQWQLRGEVLADRTNASLTLSNLTEAHGGEYAVVVSNAFGVATGAVATLIVRTVPRWVTPLAPIQLSAVPGEKITLSVETTGTLPIGYRWRYIRTNGTSGNLTNFVLNQHTCFLTLTVDATSAGAYTIILTNSAQPSSSIQRTNTVLTVLADTDADGLPDAWETTYPNASNPAADTDQDGLTNLQEYRAGTNPQDAQSYLRVETIALTGESNRVSLRFVAAANKNYTVESRPAVGVGAWTRLADVLATSSNRVVEVIDTAASSTNAQHYYRLATPRVP